ncbi:hypothetical protein QQS21_012178 [Conoideocrella luteorostrata]|uniref:ATP/GTP-binding protein n=1 Tax=Conoideocrella luteorostrata TaxID=1105319 RepID=A0AAJ0CEI6_9HYPO|nr:hypothetical protein QQS21_012178 [Conoideocrella luteorostrata]
MSNDSDDKGNSALETVLPVLHRLQDDNRPVVVMTCGISGAGKSTLAKNIVNGLPNFVRLSVDKFICDNYRLFGENYPEEKYSDYQAEAQTFVKNELIRLLDEKSKDIVLDLAFWNKEYREEYKEAIVQHGGRWVLVFLHADKDTLKRRIAGRRAERDGLDHNDQRRDGDSAFNVDDDTFNMYYDGFERPDGEGEIIIKVT